MFQQVFAVVVKPDAVLFEQGLIRVQPFLDVSGGGFVHADVQHNLGHRPLTPRLAWLILASLCRRTGTG